MSQGFYQSNGKWLNQEQLPIVFATSELVAEQEGDWRLVELIQALHRHWDEFTPEQFRHLLDIHQLEICMDEDNPDDYLLLVRK